MLRCKNQRVPWFLSSHPSARPLNVPDLVDELPMAPVSMQAATPGRQAGGEISYDFWKFAQLTAGAFSGVGQNREANNTKVAFAGKLQVQPLAFSEKLPQIFANISIFTYHKTNGFTPDVRPREGGRRRPRHAGHPPAADDRPGHVRAGRETLHLRQEVVDPLALALCQVALSP